MTKQRILYIDNLRIYMATLVIIVHLGIIYGGQGGWYYKEVTRLDLANKLFFILFFLLNKSYGLGLFFMLSGLFTAISFKNKGIKKFITDRLMRLGVPLLLFALIISPLARSLQHYFVYNQRIDVISTLKNNIVYYDGDAVGPLWFVQLLLVFTVLFLIWHLAFPHQSPVGKKSEFRSRFPKTKSIVALIALMSVVTFILRIWFPFGWVYIPIAIEPADVTQYVVYFIIGLYLPQTDWLTFINKEIAKKWLIAVGFLFAFVIAIVVSASFFTQLNLKQFISGFNWQSAVFSTWEMTYSIALNIIILYFFMNKLNWQGRLARFFSKNVYAAFVVHPIVITILTLLLKDIHIYPMLKFALVAPIAVFASFGIGHLFRILPGMNKIL